MGVLVDSVSDILTINSGEIRSVPEVEGSHHTDIISGLVNLDNRMVAILILEKLLDVDVTFSEMSTIDCDITVSNDTDKESKQ
jgi:chemotaxis signal transduction protein